MDPGSLAIDEARHRLYMLRTIGKKENNDSSVPRIYGFDVSAPGVHTTLSGFPAAAPSVFSGLSVDNSAGSPGYIYYGNHSYTPNGVLREDFLLKGAFSSDPEFDSAGHLWISKTSDATIDEYSPGGDLLKAVSVVAQGNPAELAIDRSTNDLYVAREPNLGGVWKYTAASGYESGTPFITGSALKIAFDATHHVLYVLRNSRVDAYNTDGTLVEEFAVGFTAPNQDLAGMAVDESTGTVYLSNRKYGQIMAIPGVTVPDETVGAQTGKSTVSGQVDPAGGPGINSCKLEYLPDAAFHEVQNEIQTVTLSGAAGGTFGLGFGREGFENATGTLTAGSTSVTSLLTAVGTGDLEVGSSLVSSLSISAGRFIEGQPISGAGIPAGTTIKNVLGSRWLVLSAPATAAGTGVALSSEGPSPFFVNEEITAPGIPPGTRILTRGPGALTLSQAATASSSGTTLLVAEPGQSFTGGLGTGTVSAGSNSITSFVTATGIGTLTAGSPSVSTFSTSTGTFPPGQPISGPGIPPGTTVKANFFSNIELSAPATASAAGAALFSEGPSPFVVGEAVSGAGIPAGTTIVGAAPGVLTLSQSATASTTATPLHATLPFDAPAAVLQHALETLPSVGAGNVEVSGSSGGPYTVEFKGARAGDVPLLAAIPDLTPPGATASTTTTRSGGLGWNVTPSTSPCNPGPPLTEATSVSSTLPGLVPETTYRYRFGASNANGSSFSTEKTITPHWVDRIKTEEATGIGRFVATLNGSFNGTNEDTHYHFEWGTTTSYGSESAENDAGTTTGSTPMSFEATGLAPGTIYHYRVVAHNGSGVSLGEDRTFETLPAVLGIGTDPATETAPHGAKLNASFTGTNQDTQYHFEWGLTNFYGNNTGEEDAGLGNNGASTPLSTALGGLEPETTYHYRVVATNGSGTSSGKDETFKTPPAVAGVSTGAANLISLSSVTLTGSFTGNGDATSFYFDWGTTSAYGNQTAAPPGAPAGAPNGPADISAEVSEFKGFTTYHYRLVATNSQGATYGADRTFTTPAALLPSVGSTSSSAIGATTATLEAQINPNRWDTVYLFEYGPSASYGSSTLIEGPIGSDISNHLVSAQLSGLAPGSVYHFRAVAINFAGTTYGPDRTFATPDAPAIAASSVAAIGSSTAHLSALVTANGAATAVGFEYGTDGSYGQSTTQSPIGADFVQREAGAELSGLAPGTTYHFRVVATNGLGARSGPDRTFTTQAEAPPGGKGAPKKCKAGFVKRHGKCVKHKKSHKKPHQHSTHNHG
ncbi:MAG TPA: hypothetical protein VII45_00210 [Solirubrobacterales bacterium]